MFNASIEQLNVHSDCVPVCPIRFPCNRQPNIFHPLINSTTLFECSTILCTLLQSGSQTDLKVGWVEEHTTVQLNCNIQHIILEKGTSRYQKGICHLCCCPLSHCSALQCYNVTNCNTMPHCYNFTMLHNCDTMFNIATL